MNEPQDRATEAGAAAPDVSIIIPVFNRPLLVREAIDSALGASEGLNVEVIVVDDASSDETAEVIDTFGSRVRALRLERNEGQARARNRGLAAATGAFVKFLDSDDVLVPSFLDEEVTLARASGADVVVSAWGHRYSDGRERLREAPQFENVVDDLLAGKAVTTSAALYRREVAAEWDPAIPKLADWDFCVQSILNARRVATTDGISFWVREHQGLRVSRTSMVINARSHHAVLRKLEARLLRDGLLTDARRLRLAQYFYKELRVLAVYDRLAFEDGMRTILRLDPNFSPRDEERQPVMRIAARMLGTRHAVLLYAYVKRLLHRIDR